VYDCTLSNINWFNNTTGKNYTTKKSHCVSSLANMKATNPCFFCVSKHGIQSMHRIIYCVKFLHCLFEKKNAQVFLQSHQVTEQCFRKVSKISVNVQTTVKVGLIILVALTAHCTPIFKAHCELSVIILGGGEGVHGRWQSQR